MWVVNGDDTHDCIHRGRHVHRCVSASALHGDLQGAADDDGLGAAGLHGGWFFEEPANFGRGRRTMVEAGSAAAAGRAPTAAPEEAEPRLRAGRQLRLRLFAPRGRLRSGAPTRRRPTPVAQSDDRCRASNPIGVHVAHEQPRPDDAWSPRRRRALPRPRRDRAQTSFGAAFDAGRRMRHRAGMAVVPETLSSRCASREKPAIDSQIEPECSTCAARASCAARPSAWRQMPPARCDR